MSKSSDTKHNRATRLLIAALLIMTAALGMQAQQPSLTVQVRQQVVQGQRFTVTFRVSNADARVAKAPELKGCTLLYGPATSTMSYTSIVNGRTESTSSVDYTFTYVADKAGTVTIPAMSVNAGGQVLKSPSKTLTVLPPDRSQQQQQQQQQQGAAPAGRGTGKVTAKDLIVTVTLSKNSMYEHEATIATIKVYTKYNITSFRATTLPSFDGFLSEELPVQQNVGMEHFRGENYYTAVLKRCLLFPQKTGTLSINSGRYEVTLETYEEVSNGFFIMHRPVEQHITTTSNQVNATVRPLPSPAPAGFNGAVGTSFRVSAVLEPQILRTNEAATYTYTVTGTGNVKYLTAPDIDFGPTVETYEPETDNDASFNGSSLTGTFKASYSIVPTQVGEMTVPACDFTYFNPSTGKYVTVAVPSITRKVLKGNAAVSASGNPQKAISGKQLDDILHIKSLDGDDLEREPQRVFHSWYYICAYLALIVLMVAITLIYRRNLKLNSDVTGRRMARANRVANRRLRTARAEMSRHNEDAFYAAVASALWGYMGDKLRIPASALTRDNITEKLSVDGVGPETIQRTIAVLDDCEMARFTPGTADSKMSDLYQRATTAINELEASKRKTSKS